MFTTNAYKCIEKIHSSAENLLSTMLFTKIVKTRIKKNELCVNNTQK